MREELAAKILTVKQAEAEAEAKALQGKGVANQRAAIVNGLKDSVAAMAQATGTDAEHVMALVLMTQYFDTLKELGKDGKSNTIMLPHGPGAVTELQAQLLNAIKNVK